MERSIRSLASSVGNFNAFGRPIKLWVTVMDTAAGGEHLTNPVKACAGLYLLLDDEEDSEGYPLWEQVGGNNRIEERDGYWIVCGEGGKLRLKAITSHNGRMPHDSHAYRSRFFNAQRVRERDAAMECGNGVWGHQDESGDATISARESKVHGFRYGRAVVASSDILEGGDAKIPLGCLGIVIGPSSHPSAVRVKFDSFDAPFNVNHQELDLAEGPEVTVIRPNGHFATGSIVNITDARIKIHYHGRLKSEDEWFQKDTKRILPLMSDNPDGIMECTDSDVSSCEDVPFGRRGTCL